MVTLGFPPEQSQDIAQFVAHLDQDLVALGPLRGAGSGKLLLCARDRETTAVEQFLDFQNHLHVLPSINAVAGFRFLRDKDWEFSFPESQDVWLDADDLANLADPEEKLVGNLSFWHRFVPIASLAA